MRTKPFAHIFIAQCEILKLSCTFVSEPHYSIPHTDIMKSLRDLIFLLLVICPTAISAENNKADSLIDKAQLTIYTNPKQSAFFSQKALEYIAPECPNPR